MKRKSLLFALLMALFAPWAANAQETLTVCDGTATNNYVPIYGLYVDTQGQNSEFIIPAETDGMSDMIGGTISNLAFYITNDPLSWGSPTVQVYMGEVEGTTLSSINGPTNFTTVWTGTLSNQNATMEITLSTPYTYNGGNLLIGMYVQTASSTYKSTTFSGITAPSESSRYNSGSGSGTAQSFLPKTTFTYEPAAAGDCEKPETCEVSDVTSTSATLTWSGGSGTYNVEVKGGSYADWTAILEGTNRTTTTLTLQPTTTYQARVQSVCNGDTPTSGWKTSSSFTTPCDSYDIPYTYGFEEAAPFDCWTVISGNIAVRNSTSNSHNSSYYLDFRGTTSNMIALPEFTSATNTLRVEFWTRPESTGGNSGKFAIGYMTDITDASTFVAVDTYNSTEMTATYVKKTVDMVNVPANANIAMRQFDCSTNYYWYVDDVTVKEMPSCLAPTDLAATATTTSAELSWTANSGETAWTVYYKKTSDENYTEVANVTANPYTLSGLTAATNYQYYVVANCSADDASEPSATFTFATACDVIPALGYSENFDSYTPASTYTPSSRELPICWNYINECTYSSYMYYPSMSSYTPSSYAHTGYNYVKFYSSYSSYTDYDPQPQYAILPEMENLAGTQITLYAKGYNASSTFKIGTMSDPTDPNTFTMIAEQTLTTAYPEAPFEYIIPSDCTDSYLAIMIDAATSSRTYNGAYIDDIVIVEAPTCLKPTGLAVTDGSITNSGATITWTAGGDETRWQIEFATDADFSDPLYEFAEGEPTYTFHGINESTTYYVHVQSDCGDNGESEYSNVVSFTTLQTAANLPYSNDFESENGWIFVNGNLTNAWAYGEATSNGEGSHALYISNDGGTTNAYTNNSAAMVYATKLFNFEDGTYVFSYDWMANGESTYDYLRVALVPATVTLTAATSYPSGFSTTALPTGWIALDGGSKLNLKTDWQSFASDEIEIAAGSYMMVFAWRDDTSGGSNPPAAVDNVSITKITCLVPANLAYSNVKSTQVDLTWTSDAQAWQICINDDEDNLVDVSASEATIEEGVVAYTLTGLTEETAYIVKVRTNCGSDGVSNWTSPVDFTTLAACTAEDVTISNIGHYTATVNWAGESEDGFTVKYREAAGEDAPFKEDFEDATSFANWTFTSMNTANNIASGKAGRLAEAAHNGAFGFRFSSYTSADDYNQYLVSPELTVTGDLKFFYKKTNDNNTETLQVGYSTTTNDFETEFTWIDLSLTTSWQESEAITLPDDVKYIAFHYYGNFAYYVYVDDITVGAYDVPAGEWQTVNTDETTANLSGLTPGTTYDLTVVPNCDETLASEIQQFSTISENVKWFITEGDWGTASNWEPAGAPTIDQNVTLFANATITGEAFAKSIAGTGTGEGSYTLTIEDGGKLKHLNSGVRATVKKHINSYTNYTGEGNGGYYLIANPITNSVTPSADNGFLVGNYDLYKWDYAQDLEWRNYEASSFTLSTGANGYLYANETGTDLTYTGAINAYTNFKSRICSVASNPDNYDFPSWYLLGNPYMYDAYLTGESMNALPYIKMNATGDGFENVAAGTPIEPMQGFFYQGVTGATTVYVDTNEPTATSEGKLNMNLRKGDKQFDNAILVFGGNQQMGKMTFRENSSKIYMPVDGKDCAIATAESNMGEMPVSFKAEKNGTYTLSFNAEEVSFAYLHLIDNLTGVETDLLSTPSYSFEAKTTDYANRFKLVFAAGSTDDNFAFYSNGSFVINNEGNATLQVIDITGRIIKSESINGCANVNVNAAPGVYMFRLVNGDNVKVQKVVVR